jgi:hypothetical protein
MNSLRNEKLFKDVESLLKFRQVAEIDNVSELSSSNVTGPWFPWYFFTKRYILRSLVEKVVSGCIR